MEKIAEPVIDRTAREPFRLAIRLAPQLRRFVYNFGNPTDGVREQQPPATSGSLITQPTGAGPGGRATVAERAYVIDGTAKT